LGYISNKNKLLYISDSLKIELIITNFFYRVQVFKRWRTRPTDGLLTT